MTRRTKKKTKWRMTKGQTHWQMKMEILPDLMVCF